ncbi:BTAD domain-containing putative transcriptional regulator [Nocardia sp. NRRL S-836]|uniref:BTAD domain-containing putative transcriptional regulator n=1 Tax=Nocardia sp. NRRL S-836 TaxID=1519492 RepID=UPI0006AF2408|nr:BTAD domain-containing putative transcriptional regulator [Nocardia sp. NRRL S-836]
MADVMRVDVLGPLVVGDGSVEVRGKRLRWLLMRLAMEPGRVVAAERLIADLWPDDPPVDGAAALQSLASRLRRTIGADAISSHATGYRLEAPTDVEEFCRTRDASLWRGAAFEDAPFAVDEAVRLALLRDDLTGLEALAAAHPLREDVQARLMLALHAAGRRSDALAVFDRVRTSLAETLGVDPGEALAAAHLSVLRERSVRGNLPAPVGSFVGRASDLAALDALLASNRLVTLTGFGGVGKTRLALAHAATRDEAWFVELDSAADPLAALDAALGPNPLAMPVFARLGSALVVLDNCEHVVDAAAALCARLLAEAPGVSVVATSREPLGIPGEVVHPVAPLDVEHAVRLFTARVGSALDPGVVRRVCVALDGIPLALELAAARARSLSAQQLESRVQSRLRLLDRGARTGPARHRTLRAVIDWSWELLDSAERTLLARLAVFVGGATASAVHAVCSGRAVGTAGSVGTAGVGDAGRAAGAVSAGDTGCPVGTAGAGNTDRSVATARSMEAADAVGAERSAGMARSVGMAGAGDTERAADTASAGDTRRSPDVVVSTADAASAVGTADAVGTAGAAYTGRSVDTAGSRRGTPESGTPAFQRTHDHRQDRKLDGGQDGPDEHSPGGHDLDVHDPSQRNTSEHRPSGQNSSRNSPGGHNPSGYAHEAHNPAAHNTREHTPGAPGGAPAPNAQSSEHNLELHDLWETEDLLSALVEKSLVVRTGERYRLLETVREYALEQGRTDPAAHARYYVELAERIEPLLRGPRQLEALEVFEAERANLDAALAWAVRHEPALARRMMAARTWHWLVMTKRYEEIRRWAPLVPGDPLSEVLATLGTPEAVAAAERLWQEDLPTALCALMLTSGQVWGVAELGDRMTALADRLERSDDEWMRAFSALIRGVVAGEFSEGAAPEAELAYRRALVRFRAVGDRWAVVFGLSCLVMVLINRGEFAEGFKAVSEARQVAAELGDPENVLVPMPVLVQTARLKVRIGDLAGAREDLAQVRPQYNLDQGRVAQAHGEVAYFGGDFEEAVRLYRQALDATEDSQAFQFRAAVHAGLGLALTRLGLLDQAGEQHARALDTVSRSTDGPARATVLEAYAGWLLAQGDAQRAAAALDEAERLRGGPSSDPAVVQLRDRCRAEVGVDR